MPLGVVPRSDVKFLSSIIHRLQRDKLTYYRPGKNRNAFAIILRFKGVDGVRVARMFSPHDLTTITPLEVLKKLEQEQSPATDDEGNEIPSSLTLFYMKQKEVAENRWSSAVTFPGGKRDNDDDRDDLDCVRRHAWDQLGIPLKGHFVCLGRMRDMWTYSRDMTGRGAISARFVYLHIGDMTPTLKFSDHQVASAAWVPLALLTPDRVRRDRIRHPFYSYLRTGSEMHMELRDSFTNTMMYFPSVPLPGELGDHFGDVWGSTLSWTSSLLVWDRRRRLDWPIVTVPGSFFLQYAFVFPMHGLLELIGHESTEGVGIVPLHVACLAFDVSVVLAFFAWWTYVFYLTGFVIWDAAFSANQGGKLSEEAQKMEEATQETHAGVRNWLNIPWRLIAPVEPDATIGAKTPQEYREALETQQMLHKLTNQVESSSMPQGGVLLSWNSKAEQAVRVVPATEKKNTSSSSLFGSKVDVGQDDINSSDTSSSSNSVPVFAPSQDPTVAATVLAYGGDVEEDFDKRRDLEKKAADMLEKKKQDAADEASKHPYTRPRTLEFGGGVLDFLKTFGAPGATSARTSMQQMQDRNAEWEKEVDDRSAAERGRIEADLKKRDEEAERLKNDKVEMEKRRREAQVLREQERQRAEEKLERLAAAGEMESRSRGGADKEEEVETSNVVQPPVATVAVVVEEQQPPVVAAVVSEQPEPQPAPVVVEAAVEAAPLTAVEIVEPVAPVQQHESEVAPADVVPQQPIEQHQPQQPEQSITIVDDAAPESPAPPTDSTDSLK